MVKTLLGVNSCKSKKGSEMLMLHTSEKMRDGDGRLGQSVKVLFVGLDNFENVFGCPYAKYDFASHINQPINCFFNDGGFLESVVEV